MMFKLLYFSCQFIAYLLVIYKKTVLSVSNLYLLNAWWSPVTVENNCFHASCENSVPTIATLAL